MSEFEVAPPRETIDVRVVGDNIDGELNGYWREENGKSTWVSMSPEGIHVGKVVTDPTAPQAHETADTDQSTLVLSGNRHVHTGNLKPHDPNSDSDEFFGN